MFNPKKFISYQAYLVKFSIEKKLYQLERKRNPERILEGKCVVMTPTTEQWESNELHLMTGNHGTEELVREYDCGFVRTVGKVSINNNGGTMHFWAFSTDEAKFGETLPIYTLSHDNVLYIGDSPQAIKSAIYYECDRKCVIK